jgi:large subunit ribosomal protein L19
MNTVTADIKTSPVNIEDRKNLGIKPGDTVKVHQKIQDKGKTRIQVFDGIVLARKHGNEPGATFTVRKIASGVGVEKVFPLYSPLIDKIEIVKRAKVRRAKLYYIREKVARQIKRQMRRMSLVQMGTESETEAAARVAAEEAAAEEARAAAEAAEAEKQATVTEENTSKENATAEEVAENDDAAEAPEESTESSAEAEPAEVREENSEEAKKAQEEISETTEEEKK